MRTISVAIVLVLLMATAVVVQRHHERKWLESQRFIYIGGRWNGQQVENPDYRPQTK